MDADSIKSDQKKSYETVKAAFENETHLFIHVHFRGYDEKGKGENKNARFFDKYGAPIDFEETWSEGYRSIEQHLLTHNEACLNKYTHFPLVGGYGGGAHLYKKYNEKEPWNWTGWIPLHQYLPYDAVSPAGGTQHVMYSNRFFLCLRGNEIQNDMWDYDPNVNSTDEEVKGPYRGGYWYDYDVEKRVASRYLHIIALKTCEDDVSHPRYNYIVHPLAYRIMLDDLPDCGVDYIQWAVNNINKEKHFKPDGDWGSKVNGIELFNDYSYYYSWICHYNRKFHNGDLVVERDIHGAKMPDECIIWYDTYPLEWCEFILDKALSCGTYLQALAANDAFYNRSTSHIDNGDDHGMEPAEKILVKRNQELLSDPKGKYVTETVLTVKEHEKLSNLKNEVKSYLRHKARESRPNAKPSQDELVVSNNFLESRPYKYDTVFAYTAMLDCNGELKKATYPPDSESTDLKSGENIIINKMVNGQFYSHTGIYNMFNYSASEIQVPYVVAGQSKRDQLWFNEEIMDFKLKFFFTQQATQPQDNQPQDNPPPWNGKLIWRYTIEYVDDKERVVSTGYFKLDRDLPTELDLQYYEKFQVKWIRFTIFYVENPQQRAWFSPIRGKYFNFHTSDDMPLRNRIAKKLDRQNLPHQVIFTDTGDDFKPTAVPSNDNLKYVLDKGAESHLHSYFMQVNPLQQIEFSSGEEESPVGRYLQNVHGYFARSGVYPTELFLSTSWDHKTLKDNKIYFYRVDGETCEPFALEPRK